MELPQKVECLLPKGLMQSSYPLALRAVTAGLVLLGSRWFLRKLSDYREANQLTEKREKARLYKKQSVGRVVSIIENDSETKINKDIITAIPPLELVEKIKNGEYTAVQVLRAYQAKALSCEKHTNAICFFYEDAEQWAKECDENPIKLGRFFGLPISVKDRYKVEGYDTIMGYSKNIGKSSTETALIVKIMRREGAVPFVQTNVPQTMMSFQSSNSIYGATRNPFDPKRGPGGSSSGEGAIVGYGASPLGLGSDIAGSVRVPAAFCGCAGFKPTTYRISTQGSPPTHQGQSTVCGTLGPLAPDVDTIIEFCKAIWDHDQMFEMDTKIPPIKFNHKLFETERSLRIGMYINLGTVDPVPAVYRSMEIARAALEAQGHTVIPWTPPGADTAWGHLLTLVNRQWTQALIDALRNDKLDYSVAHFIGIRRYPKWYQRIKAFLQDFHDPEAAFETRSIYKMKSSLDYWDAYESVMLDACIGPSFPFPAMPLVNTGNMTSEKLYWVGATYTLLYNVLNQPAGVVPVTKVTNGDLQEMKNWSIKTKVDKAIHEGMKGGEGLPLACQVIALRFRDEMVLRVMKELETGLKTVNISA